MLKVIAHIRTDFPEKFGLPRQSGLVEELQGRIVFEPEYRNPDALRGLEEYDYLWLIWGFQGTEPQSFCPTVRPPRLGGNQRMGVFATRSPFRPNSLGLSSVKLEGIEQTDQGPVILVSGIDMRDNTPIYDIKPYLPYVDSHPQARGGFAHQVKDQKLQVQIPEELLQQIPPEKTQGLLGILQQDPRPHYQNDPDRIYGLEYAGWNIRFKVCEQILTVIEIEKK